MDTTIQKSYYCFLKSFIEEHLQILRESRVFIFGAGIRGRNLLLLLRMFQIEDICFVDNSPEKQGSHIEDCPVLAFEQAKAYSDRHVFLCPVENGETILNQLKETGREENKDYFNLDFLFTDYADLIKEIEKPGENPVLIFGDCIFSSYILGREMIPALGERIKEELFGKESVIYALPGFSPEIYYIILYVLLLRGKRPGAVIMATDFSALSPYNFVMMGRQNQEQITLFLEGLARLIPGEEKLQEFLHLNRKRLEKSMHGGRLATAKDSGEAIRKVYKLKYLYDMKENDESVVYTKKILKQMNEMEIPVFLQFQPVDYQRGEKVFGDDFKDRYSATRNGFLSFFQEYSYCELNAGFLEESDCFVPPTDKPDINPFLNKKGQDALICFLKEQKELQPFLI